jgi:Raf kinase inhibitor-like YbhB/YbcL family protein
MCRWSLLAVVLVTCAGCKSGPALVPSPPPGVTLATLTVTSKSFPVNGPIPIDHSCDGADRSPQLTWSAPPAGTKSFAIVVDDPDAQGSAPFTHWIAFDVGGDVLALPEGADLATLGASAGTNDFKRPGWGGPCPPKMEIHHYHFRVYALDTRLTIAEEVTRGTIDAALNGHVLAEGTLVGTFSH